MKGKVGRRFRLATLPALVSLALLLAVSVGGGPALAAPNTDENWTSDSTYSISFVGRDGPGGEDHYHATLGWGATFFGMAVDSMPLLPADRAVNLLMDGYMRTFPGRTAKDIQPDDSFDFFVPPGTLVCTQWQQKVGAREFRSLRGDLLDLYTYFRSPIDYRLIRSENPGVQQVAINRDRDIKPYDLARAIYGQEDPDFKPDFLQVARATVAQQNHEPSVDVDQSRSHLDDFLAMRASSQPDGKDEQGLDVYWFRSNQESQPLFRVDDSVGDNTDSDSFASPIRVYYYKDGTVRTYQRASDTLYISGRQPQNDQWSKVYSQANLGISPPTRWDVGEPEQDAAAQQLNKLGIVALRYQPKQGPPGNFFTHILDLLMGLMSRKN